MNEWKTQIGYKYNPSYHAYAYGLMYQPAPEQNHGNPLSCWGEPAVTDLSNYNPGVTQAYYATAAKAREESPPVSPEQHAASGHHSHHYQGSGVLYLADSTASRLLRTRPHRADYDDVQTDGVSRVGSSDSTSDSEAHTSPESWSSSSSSSSSREGGLPQTDPVSWTKKDHPDESNERSPVINRVVSSTMIEEPVNFTITGNEGTNDIVSLPMAVIAPTGPSTPLAKKPKGKVRAAFSEAQMNTLLQRFRVQRYLTPAEMKNLAETTGLTYQQVKTWFQNRRVKLRRHQKDSSWVSERYAPNKDAPLHGPMYPNIPTHMPTFRGETQPQLKDPYSQHMMKPTPQNLAFYLAAMGGAAGSNSYPSWSANPSQPTMPTRPQAPSWSMPPPINHYEYNPSAFNVATANGPDHNFESKNEAPVSS